MNDTTRMIIAFVAIMAILLVWQILTPKRRTQPINSQPVTTTQTQTSKDTQGLASTQQPTALQIAVTQKPVQPETEITLENKLMRVVFSNIGGTIKSIYLKKYQAELVPANSRVLETKPSQNDVDVNWNIIYHDDSTIIFEGLFKKTYRLHNDYTLSLNIEGTTSCQISFESGIAMTEANHKEEYRHFALFYKNSNKPNKLTAMRLKPTVVSNIQWIGLKSKYFTMVLSSPSSMGSANITPLTDGRIGYAYQPSTTTNNYLLYFGPLDYDILRGYHFGWEALKDLGWTRIFSVAILKLLQFLYSIFRNYGVAIIIFAILIKAIFFPLTRMTNKQMMQMQMLQPKLEELKKKYKSDPQALNRETMQLYRLYKINPFSGCLPLIFQLPIFWALYSVLQKTIELRHASFVFWIKDLSVKDPHLILPILMGVSFLIQNFLTSADKRNMALMIFMPIFLTVIFLNFPSGLQLYWFIFNLLSIVESIISRGGFKWKTQKTLTPVPTK
jgi:YidC/Oxa1 family membrane protein insertase